MTTYLFAFTGSDTVYNGVVIIEYDGGDAGEHFLEVLLQPGDVLTVADDLQQVLITHEVETTRKLKTVFPLFVLNNK